MEKFESARPNADFQGVSDVDPQEVWKNREKVVLVDVRRPDEYNGELGHVAGSKHIVLDNLPEQIDDLPKDRTVVFICRSGQRSARATTLALANGFQDVFNMKGGMLLWNQLKLEIAKD